MATQQEVIKKFMKSLDTTPLMGSAAVDAAIKFASDNKYSTAQEVINEMKTNIDVVNNADKFLRDYCGIILDNADTGAITGSDAGGSIYEKNASAIIPEVGVLENFTGTFFNANGLTIRLAEFPKYDTTGELTINSQINFDDLFCSEKYKDSQARACW